MISIGNFYYYQPEIVPEKGMAKNNRVLQSKKTSILLFLSIVLFVVFVENSCKYKKYNYTNYQRLKSPDRVIKLKSSEVNKFELLWPTEFAVIDNYLILVDKKGDKLINIIDLNSDELKICFGGQGQGPDEFVSISQIIPDPNLKDRFWIYDISTLKLKCFNISNVLDHNFYPEKMIDISSRKGFLTQLILFPDQRMVGTGLLLEGRVAFLNPSGDIVRVIGKIPVIFKNERFAPHHSHGFLGNIAYKERTQEIYLATRYGSIIEKYNMDGKTVSTLIGPDLFFPDYDIVPAGEGYTMAYNKNTRDGYLDIKYNRKMDELFLLYSGKKKFSKDGKLEGGGRIIYVLDNKDKFVEQIELDKDIYQIWISDDCSIILGLSDKRVLKYDYIHR
ncbi:MAG: BF3164 family lipoprotein [Candidatus Saccharicenans sp.]